MSTQMTEEEKEQSANRLAAGRILATESHPYLSRALFAMVPVPREGLGTFAVDRRWRLYYDPALCLQWSASEIAAAWLHEVGHLVRDHAKRFEQYSEQQYAEKWNHAADAAINSDLRSEGITLPMANRRFYAEPNQMYPAWNSGMTTEEMYEIAKGSGNQKEDPPGKGEPSQSEDSEPTEDENSEQEQSGEAGQPSEAEDTEDSTEENKRDAPDDGSDGEESDTENTMSSPQENKQESSTGKGEPEQDEEHDCGSGASGGSRDYEEPSDADDGSLDPDEGELVRQETAKDILDAARRGNVPAGMIREAEDIIEPQVDWRTELMSIVRRTCASVAGKRDYSYKRPSRRSAMTPFYLPSMRSPRPPELVVVLDTSGSMTPTDLAVALSEIQGIIDRSSSSSRGSLKVVNCDADVSDIEAVSSVEDVVIIGGGGTDMRVGISRASELYPKPDAIITITDGGTPWPKEPDARGTVYINVIVKSKLSEGSYFITPPEWMHTIYVDRRPSRIRL